MAALCQSCHAAACSTCNAPDACTGSLHTSFTYQTAGMHTSCVHNVIIALASSKQTGSTSYSPRYTCMQKERLRRTGITTHGFSSAWCTPFKELYICCARHTADKAWSRLQCRRRLHASDLGGLGAGGACTVSAAGAGRAARAAALESSAADLQNEHTFQARVSMSGRQCSAKYRGARGRPSCRGRWRSRRTGRTSSSRLQVV